MQAEILAIGTELLRFGRLDTNSLFLARGLLGLGIAVAAKTVLPDDQNAIAAAMRAALARSEVVITSGGLGPTEDDCTVAAAAQAVGCALIPDAGAERRLRVRFRSRHRRFAARQLRQALRLQIATWLPNACGSALGQWCRAPGGRVMILLPGPSAELNAMFAAAVVPRLKAMAPPLAYATRVLSIAGLGEDQVEAVAAPIYRRVRNPATTILATTTPQIELHFHATAATPAAAARRADTLAGRIARRLGTAVFSHEQEGLHEVVAAALVRRRHTLALAESCTGGMIGERLTEAGGASAFFLGGVVCYANSIKQDLVGVRATTLQRYGAVSAATAREMAAGARARLRADWGLAVTGIAGPAGGSAAKPVGTVFIAVAGPGASRRAWKHRFFGDRDRIRRFSTQAALNHLRLALLELEQVH